MNGIIVESGVSVIFSAAHYEKGGKKRLHGHTYEARAYYPEGTDAVKLKAQLAALVRPFDHGLLPSELCWAEPIARFLLERLPEALSVEINRDREGFFARARRVYTADGGTHDRARKWWTTPEIGELRRLVHEGVKRREIARRLGRSPDSIKGQIERLRIAGENV